MLCTTGLRPLGRPRALSDRPPRRLPDKGQHGLEALYRLYPCQEGWIFLAARREAEWQRLARTLDRPGWLDDPCFATRADRLSHDDELVEQLGALFRTRPADDWVHDLRAADLPVARADSDGIDDFLLQNDLLMPAEHPDFGKYWRPHLTVNFPSMPPGSRRPPASANTRARCSPSWATARPRSSHSSPRGSCAEAAVPGDSTVPNLTGPASWTRQVQASASERRLRPFAAANERPCGCLSATISLASDAVAPFDYGISRFTSGPNDWPPWESVSSISP